MMRLRSHISRARLPRRAADTHCTFASAVGYGSNLTRTATLVSTRRRAVVTLFGFHRTVCVSSGDTECQDAGSHRRERSDATVTSIPSMDVVSKQASARSGTRTQPHALTRRGCGSALQKRAARSGVAPQAEENNQRQYISRTISNAPEPHSRSEDATALWRMRADRATSRVFSGKTVRVATLRDLSSTPSLV